MISEVLLSDHAAEDLLRASADVAKNLTSAGIRVDLKGDFDQVGEASAIEGDAQALPYADCEMDAVTIAFGIRNVPDRARALREMARVVRPGGRIAILELSEGRRGLMGAMARFHTRHVVPKLGALLSGRREYHYLQKSIAAFLDCQTPRGRQPRARKQNFGPKSPMSSWTWIRCWARRFGCGPAAGG